MEQESEKGFFTGYCNDTKGYRVWIPEENKIEVTRDIVFKENLQNTDPLGSVTSEDGHAENFVVFGPGIFESESSVDNQKENPIEDQQLVVDPVQYNDDEFEEDNWYDIDSDSKSDSTEDNDKSRYDNISTRTRAKYFLVDTMEIGHCFVSVREPTNFEMALTSDDSSKWKEAMDD